MGDITLAAIAEGVGLIAAIIGGFAVLYNKLKGWIEELTGEQIKKIEEAHAEQMEKIETEIRTLETKISASDMESCKNFLVRCIADLERGQPMSETEYQRFCEQYEHYTQNNGNTYIKEKVDRLKKAGKL